MAYILCDANGYVADVASISGLDEISIYINGFPWAKEAQRFLDEGSTTHVAELIDELDRIIPVVSTLSARTTLTNLKNNLARVDEIAILSQ